MRGMDSIESGQRYVDGWSLNYNLFRKHESLKNKPPASLALKDPPFSEWADVVKEDAVEPQLVLKTAAPRLADEPKLELQALTPPKPTKSSRGSGSTGTGAPRLGRAPKVKTKKQTAPRKGKAATKHPYYKIRQRERRKHGGGKRRRG